MPDVWDANATALPMLARSQTAPCLLQELIRFDPLGKAFSQSDKLNACKHAYIKNSDRSRIPSPKELPTASTTYSVAATCQNCRNHFDALLDFPADTYPCPSQNNPFHLFQHMPVDPTEFTKSAPVVRFQCSSQSCRAELLLLFRAPVLTEDDLAYLTNPLALEARLKTAQLKFPDLRPKSALEVLKIFRSAMVDSLEKEDKDMRDIPLDNKMFKACLGDGIEDLFLRLGFTKVAAAGSAKVHWRLPRPGKHPFSPSYDETRSKLEDVRDELSIMMLRRPESERKLLTSGLPDPLAMVQPDLEKILGIQPEEAKSLNLANLGSKTDNTPYRCLGALQSFPDDLIAWTFDAQMDTNPANRSDYVQCLKEIGDMRRSEDLQTKAAIAESLTTDAPFNQFILSTYAEALSFLNAQDNTSDEFIWTLMTAKAAENSTNEAKARHAVELIAEKRNSESLRNQLAGTAAAEPEMTLEKAYKTLGVTQEIEDEHLIAQCEMNTKESPARKNEFRKALQTIAEQRQSYNLWSFLGGQQPSAPPSAKVMPFAEPRAIKNIGNTCYLNSLLQYLFTIRPLRELVAKIDQFGEDPEAPGLASKKVGDTRVTRTEVRRALTFARELDHLFVSLRTVETPIVTPSTSLARLTLINVVDRDVQRRASTITAPAVTFAEQPPVSTSNNDETAIVLECSTSPEDLSSVQEGVKTEGTSDTAMSDTSSFVSIPNPNQNTLTESNIDSTEKHEDKMEVDNNVQSEFSGITIDASQPPPVPTRLQAKPEQPSVTQEVENWARQQDVREVMQNVLSQLRWAIQPQSHEKNGEQIDIVSQLFYGKEKYTVMNEKGEQPSVEPFLEIVLYLSGATNIYSALDDIYDASEVEGLANTSQYRTITEAPPILQFSVSRVGYNKATGTPFKVNDPLELYEHLYLDRYTDDDSILFKRRQAWTWKNQLRSLKAQRAQLDVPDLELDAAGVLGHTSQYLKGLAAYAEKRNMNISLIDDALLRGIEKLAVTFRDRIVELDQKIKKIENDLQELFERDQRLAYRLHAVFIHRGDSNAKGGHWFIYIHDPEQNEWRCYNDETITKVTNTRPIFTPVKDWAEGTSSFIVYVREDVLGDVVQTVYREAQAPTEDSTVHIID